MIHQTERIDIPLHCTKSSRYRRPYRRPVVGLSLSKKLPYLTGTTSLPGPIKKIKWLELLMGRLFTISESFT